MTVLIIICLFHDRVANFPQEPRIWDEVVKLAEALKSEDTEDAKFLAGIF